MRKTIYIETSRAKCGYAKATISRFANYSTMKYEYSFRFYNTIKFFKTYKELRNYVEENYKITFGFNEHHLPETRKEFFK